MPRSRSYFTLIGSLPALPAHFEQAERVPISRFVLLERLKMLATRDADVVEQMRDFLVWERQPLERSNKEVIQRYEKFVQTVPDRFAREIIQQAMTVRTIISALRCRRLGIDAPQGGPPVTAQIARHWNQPDFQLGAQFPWITEMDAQLNGNSPFDIERMKLNILWNYAKRKSEQFHFSFEAVVLYLIRWEAVYRWTMRNAEAGQEKFDTLVSEAMGEYANLYAE